MGARVRLVRSGGLAGLDMVADVDLDDLPAEAAAAVRAGLGQLHGGRPHQMPRSEPGPGGGADRYQYDLEVNDGGRRRLTAHEPDIPPGLQAVIDVLLPLAHPE